MATYNAAVKTLATFFLLLLAHAVGAAPQNEDWIRFDPDLPARPIGNHITLLEDTTASLGIGEIIRSKAFKANTEEVPNLGLSNSAFWMRFTVVNAHPSEKITLMFDYPELEHVDIFMNDQSGLRHLMSGGQARNVDRRTQTSPTYTCNLDLAYGAMGTLYIRLQSDKQIQAPVFLVTQAEAERTVVNRAFFIGGYIGIMLVMALYNLFLFISIRDRSYILYVVSIISVTLAQASFTGYLGFYFLGHALWIKQNSSLIFTVSTAICANIFMDNFIGARKHISSFRYVINTFFALLLLAVGINVAGARIEAYGIVQLLSMLLAMYTLWVAVTVARKGVRAARFFLTAWCIFLAGIIVFVAKDWGLVPYNDLTKYMMTIGSSFEVVLLSLGLADKINVLRREKEQLILDQYQNLELKVAERTQALQESNDHLKRTQTQLVTAEKMASLGQLTAGIAHEINNPINFISSSIPPLKRDLDELREVLDAYREIGKDIPAMEPVHRMEKAIDTDYTIKEVEEILAAMEQGAARTSEIVRGLRTFSRLDEDDLKEADVNACLRSTVVVLGPQFRDAVKLEYDLGDLPMVECFPGKLNQLFMNLLNNAAHAAKKQHGASGAIVRIETRSSGDHAQIVIADNGVGMTEDVRVRLFEPFFTTKDVGEGTGLGLSIVKGIVDKHNGTIDVKSEPGVGTVFTVSIPVTQSLQHAKCA